MDNQQVINNTAEKQFQYPKNGLTAVIDYKIMGNKLLLLATRVPPELAGQGVGSTLVKQTFDLIENMNLEVVPVCSFIQGWLRKHPEKHHLLA